MSIPETYRKGMMTDSVTISLVGACATVALAVVNGVFSVVANARSKRNEGHLVETKEAVMKVQRQTDGMSDCLLKVTGEAEFAKGLKQGTEEGKQL